MNSIRMENAQKLLWDPRSRPTSVWSAGLHRISALKQRCKRVGRVLAGNDLFWRTDVHCHRVRLGDAGAAFCVNPDLLTPESVVYSLGIGANISFDVGLLSLCVREVHAFDPTPRSLAWIARQRLPAGLHIHPFGVSDYDGVATFAPPEEDSHVSYQMVRGSAQEGIEAPVYRLATIMRRLHHRTLDLLKIDIEGAEYGVIDDLVASRIQIRQLCVEFHHRWRHVGVKRTVQAIGQLRAAGFWMFDVSPSGEEFSFIHQHVGMREERQS